MPAPFLLDEEFVFSRCEVDPNSGCWLWAGELENGYPVIRLYGAVIRVHRAVLERKIKQSLGSLFACHACDTRACTNPDHLFVGTQTDNMRDMAQKGPNRIAYQREPRKPKPPPSPPVQRLGLDEELATARRLREAGLSYAQIGQQIGRSKKHAWMLVNR